MSGLKMHLRLAESRSDVLRCQHLIAEIYNRDYGVVFSEEECDLEAKIESWPHRYLMGLVGNELVAACGLYIHSTYVERFGKIEPEEFRTIIEQAGALPRYSWTRMRENSKVVVQHDYRGHGLARFFASAMFSRHFIQVDTKKDEPVVILGCATQRLLDNLFQAEGVRTRIIKLFPVYRMHERYRLPENPMYSVMVIPELDIPERWYNLPLPGTYEVCTGQSDANMRPASREERIKRLASDEGRVVVCHTHLQVERDLNDS